MSSANTNTGPAPLPRSIDSNTFRGLIDERSRGLLRVARGYIAQRRETFVLTRPLLAVVQAEATQLEELLDAYGARTNSRWHRFRERVAGLRNFAIAGHELLHLEHAVSGYHIACADGEFHADTRRSIEYVGCLILCCLRSWHEEAAAVGLHLLTEGNRPDEFAEDLPLGRLPRDRRDTHRTTVAARIVNVATQCLHETERARFLRNVLKKSGLPVEERLELIGDTISEERLRGLEMRFHNLQSLYDTHIGDSDTERLDADLPSLRGHISAVLHLLRIATTLVHFHERHVVPNEGAFHCREECPLKEEGFLEVLINYCLGYTWRFLEEARETCRGVLRCYADIGTIDLPVPTFHGFHVRPSTLVSLIVAHYGSDVTLECGGASYNAALPMDLFRANEWINQQKRERVLAHLSELPLQDIEERAETLTDAVREVLIRLAGRKIVSLHQHPLELHLSPEQSKLPFRELLARVITRLLRERTINIESEITVRATGDKRVLADLQVLADNGYGEDEAGRNRPFPDALSYLRHSRET